MGNQGKNQKSGSEGLFVYQIAVTWVRGDTIEIIK